ncbi:uncharacterized protein LOC143136118 [Alosa pseudoharengus]|uniref:uncharacterized protein LOC143136118 n=1 Tax=Alosa pseudoharengus TaxID=34774 RepID=UPI003F8A7E11
MQSETHCDPPSNLSHNGQSVGTTNGSQIPNPSMNQHHYITAWQPQLFTQHGLHFLQTGHHGDGVNGRSSAEQTPVYLSVGPGCGTLTSGHNMASAGTQHCVQSQPMAMVQSQRTFLINTYKVRLHRGNQPQDKLNSDKSSSHSSIVSQSHQFSGSKQVQKPTMDQISGGISNHQKSFPGKVTLLIKQSDLVCAAKPEHVLKDQRTVVSCGDDRSQQSEQERNMIGRGMVQASSTLSTGQSGSSVLHISDSRFNGVKLANRSSLLASQSVFTTSLTSLQSTCCSSDNGVPSPPTIISQGLQSKYTSSQGLSTSLPTRSSAHISTSYPNSLPPGLHISRPTQTRVDVRNMLVQTVQGQSKKHTQRAVAVVPPTLQQRPDDDERKKEKGDEQSIKIHSVWSDAAENTDENISKPDCHPSVIAIDGSDVKSSTDHKRVVNEGCHQTVVSFKKCVPNLSQSTGQKSDVAKHPKMKGSIVDLKSKTEEITTQPNQHATTNTHPEQNYGLLGSIRDPVKFSLRMLKEFIANLEAEQIKQNGKSDDSSDLVHTLLDLYWGGSSYNYKTAKAEGVIENILQEATEFNIANDSVVFDGMKVEDLYQLKERFHIPKWDCNVSVSDDIFKSSSRGIKEKVGGLDKQSTENSFISETCSLLPPEHIETMVGVSLEDPHCSPSAKTLDKATDLERTGTNNAEDSQKPAISLSNLHVSDNEIVTDTEKNAFYSSNVPNIRKCKKQDDCGILELEKTPEKDYTISPKSPRDFAVKLTMLSSEDIMKMFDCENNGKIKNLCENLSSTAPSTAEESNQGFTKMKMQVLSPDEAKALSKLFNKDDKEGFCTSSPDMPHRHADDDEDETGLGSLQKGNVNPDQIQEETVDGKTLDLSGGSVLPCIFANNSGKGIHSHTITADKMVLDKNKLSMFKKVKHSSPDKTLTVEDAVKPRCLQPKSSNAQKSCGTTTLKKLSHGPTTSQKAKKGFLSSAKYVHGAKGVLHPHLLSKSNSCATLSVKDLARSNKRKWVEHGSEDQVTLVTSSPPKPSIVFSPMEKSAKEKVLKNWESTFVPTNVKSRRLSVPSTKETSFSSSEFKPRRHEKT